MVIRNFNSGGARLLRRDNRRQKGFLITEMVVALSILALVLIPLSLSFYNDQKLCRIYYYRAIAMEIVDGEMEVLRAGEWKHFEEGSQPYAVHAGAANNLPPGRFILTRSKQHFQLEWLPEKTETGGRIIRETEVKL